MSDDEFDSRMSSNDLDDKYAEYLMAHAAPDRLICNGDQLVKAMEDGFMADQFKESLK